LVVTRGMKFKLEYIYINSQLKNKSVQWNLARGIESRHDLRPTRFFLFPKYLITPLTVCIRADEYSKRSELI